MYAAAGGASCRQARQRKRQENTKNRQLLQQQRLAAAKTGLSGTTVPTRQQQPSRQFHQLPSTYLRTPQGQARKLSAGYTTQSKLLLPIDEANQQHQTNTIRKSGSSRQLTCTHVGQSSTHSHPHHHHHHHPHHPQQQQQEQQHLQHLHHHHHLTKSATATLPLVCQAETTPPTSPIVPLSNISKKIKLDETRLSDSNQMVPNPKDSLNVLNPTIPIPSPYHLQETSPKNDGTNDFNMERKCSFYRMQRTNAIEDEVYNLNNKTVNQQQTELFGEDSNVIFGKPNGISNGKWTQVYCEQEICWCDQIECAQGRAAWLERGRRCSVQDNNTACHRRWVKGNRIQDASLGGSSDEEDFLGVLRGPSTFANAFLYVGLGTVAIGLVIAFVGTGEKGFKTAELRLIGPSLIGIGLICCILRICFCICPSHCISSSKRAQKKNANKVDPDYTTSLLRNDSKRVSISKNSNFQKFPLTHKNKSNNKMMNEGMEALRQFATTSLFLQNEQKITANRVVPLIKEPETSTEEPLEMKKLESGLDILNISDDDEDDETVPNFGNQTDALVQSQSKLARERIPTNLQLKAKTYSSELMETSLITTNLTPPPSIVTIIPPSPVLSLDSNLNNSAVLSASKSDIIEVKTSKENNLQPPSAPILIEPSIHTRSSQIKLNPELVLSPAKLGQ